MIATLITLTGAAIVAAGGRLFRTQRPWLPVALATLAAAAAALAVEGMNPRDPAETGHEQTLWGARLVGDPLALSVHWLAIGLGTLVVLTSTSRAAHERLSEAVRKGGQAPSLSWPLARQTTRSGSQSPSSDSHSDRLGLVLLAVAGLMLTAAAQDLVLMFVAIEVVSLATVLAVGMGRDQGSGLQISNRPAGDAANLQRAQRDDLKSVNPTPILVSPAVVPSIVSSAVLLLGFGLLYGLTASTDLAAVRAVLAASYTPADPTLAVGRGSILGVAAVVLIFAGLGWRLAVVPFHFGLVALWTADLRDAVLHATLPRAAALVVIIRVVVDAMPGFDEPARQVAMLVGGLTLVVAGVRALSRTSLRPMLGDLIVLQGGFVLIGVAAALAQPAREAGLAAGTVGPGGTAAAMFALGVSLAATAGLLAALLSLEAPEREVRIADDLAGLVRTRPATALCLVVCLVALAGLPPVAGFWSRWLAVFAALTAPAEASAAGVLGLDTAFVLVVLAGLAGTFLAVAAVVRLLEPILLVGPRGRPAPITRPTARAAALFAALAIAAASLMPGRAIGLLGPDSPGGAKPVSQTGVGLTDFKSAGSVSLQWQGEPPGRFEICQPDPHPQTDPAAP